MMLLPLVPEGSKRLLSHRRMDLAAVELASGERAVVLCGVVYKRQDALQFVIDACKIAPDEIRGITRLLQTNRSF